jgi:hypothetical protein
MALPQQIDPNTPLVTDQVGQGDDQIRAFKLAVTDIFGIPVATNVNNAYLSGSASGLLSAIFQNAGANPAIPGQLQRNAGNLLWHDGTAARTLLTSLNGAVPLAAVLTGTMAGNYTTFSTVFVDVDVANLRTTVTIPVGAKKLLIGLSLSVQIAGVAGSEDKIKVTAAGVDVCSCYNNNAIFGTYNHLVMFGAVNNPTSGAQVISLQFRNALGGSGGSTTVFNTGAESVAQRTQLFYMVAM